MQFPKFFGDISRTRTKQSLFAIFLTTRTIRAGGEWVRSRTRTTSAALDRLTNWLNIRKSIKPSTFFYFLSGDVSFLFLGFLSFWERYQVSLWVSPLNIWLQFVLLAHWAAPKGRGAHLCEDPVEPLQGPVQVKLYPAGSRGDRLSTVLGAPPLDKRHADGAHPRETVDRLKSLVDWLREKRGELLVVENFQVTTRRNLAHSGRMPAVALVAVRRLHKNGWLWLALSKDLAPDIVQPHALPYVPPCLLHHRVAVDVRQQTEAEPISLTRVGEPVHGNARLRRVERLAHPGIELVIRNGAPKSRLAVHHRLRLKRGRGTCPQTWRGEFSWGIAARGAHPIPIIGDVAGGDRRRGLGHWESCVLRTACQTSAWFIQARQRWPCSWHLSREVLWDQHWGQDRLVHLCIMVRVDTHLLTPKVEGELTVFNGF